MQDMYFRRPDGSGTLSSEVYQLVREQAIDGGGRHCIRNERGRDG